MINGQVNKVAIVGANRIPFVRSDTAYAECSNQEMLHAAIEGLVERFDLQGKRLGEVVAGAVIKHSRDFNLTREAVLDTSLSPDTPCYDIQQACGTGLEAAILVANKIALGQIEVGIAGGTDTTSDAPVGFGDGLRKALLEARRAKTTGQRLKALAGIKWNDLVEIPANAEARTGMSMGEHCQITAKRLDVSREDQDALALASHHNLAAAYDEGFMDDLVTPYKGVERDGILRPDSKAEKLASLKPVFDRENGTMTAANSTALSDGASAVLLASEDYAKANNLPIMAYLTLGETAAVDFIDEKEGLLMAPAYAVPEMLKKKGLTLQDFDYYEIHEAFAAQVLATLKIWESEDYCKEKLGLDGALGEIDRSKLNVKGSSLAAGHPFAATGGRLLGVAAKLLNEKGSGRVLLSVCAAGGQGITAIVEK